MKLVLREKCPVCENQTANVIYSIPYGSADLQTYLWSFYGEQGYPNPEELLGAEFTLHECENCQLVYQSRIPDSDSLTELYTRWISYDKVSEKFLKNRGQDKFDRNFLMLRALIDHFGTRHFRIFDYGFGYAELLKQAVALGIEAYGLEFNEEQVKMAQDAGIKVVDFSNDVDVPKMDVIFCEQVLEHVTEPRQLMAHLAKISKPGTILHLSVPNSIHVQRVIRSIDWKRIKGGDLSVNIFAPLEHINSFRRRQLVYLANDFGYQPFNLPRSPKITWMQNELKHQAKSLMWDNRNFLRRLFSRQRPSESTAGYFIFTSS